MRDTRSAARRASGFRIALVVGSVTKGRAGSSQGRTQLRVAGELLTEVQTSGRHRGRTATLASTGQLVQTDSLCTLRHVCQRRKWCPSGKALLLLVPWAASSSAVEEAAPLWGMVVPNQATVTLELPSCCFPSEKRGAISCTGSRS